MSRETMSWERDRESEMYVVERSGRSSAGRPSTAFGGAKSGGSGPNKRPRVTSETSAKDEDDLGSDVSGGGGGGGGGGGDSIGGKEDSQSKSSGNEMNGTREGSS
jgi:hypothetical protein